MGDYNALVSKALWTIADGNIKHLGSMGECAIAPDINTDLLSLKRLVVVAVAQTGKNAFGADGGGVYFYFTDAIDVLSGPVYSFDKRVKPGGLDFM